MLDLLAGRAAKMNTSLKRRLPATSGISQRWLSSSKLIMPTQADADELFQRMNARPGSIIVNDESNLAKYNQDWTVGHQPSRWFFR
jgi:hypothetical protein